MTSDRHSASAKLVRSIVKAMQKLPGEMGTPASKHQPTETWRPLMVDGRARRAAVTTTDVWDGPHPQPRPDTTHLSPSQRDALSAAWLEDALDEHAAVAAFSRFTLRLLALGAPPDLLRAANRASLDEITHAELCFSLASAYALRPLGAGPLDTRGINDGLDRETSVKDAIIEGCLGETVNAMVLATAEPHCRDPEVKRVLQRISTDEMRHASLAWRFVRWAIRDDADLQRVARDTFAQALNNLPSPPSGNADGAWLRDHGRLSQRERAEVALACARDVIGPCAKALVAGSPRSFADAARLMLS